MSHRAVRTFAGLTLAALCAVMLGSCKEETPTPPPMPPTPTVTPGADAGAPIELPTLADTKPRDYAGLHNVVAFHDGFYSGSVPEGDDGFATLRAMGVKTIISVDGAVPEVERAKALGMRYIHLPIGYNGFNEARRLELARAARDAMEEGPVYIHCHHGKHRSAGAAGAIAASLGWATPQAMSERMKVSGTSPAYKGLYACTLAAVAVSPEELDAVDANFPEVSRPQGLVRSMLEIDTINDHLKLIQKAGWRTPGDHPDLVPVAEAGRMADILRLLCEDEHVKSKPADMLEMLRADAQLAQHIEDMLDAPSPDVAKLSAQFELLQAGCKDCHAKHRD